MTTANRASTRTLTSFDRQSRISAPVHAPGRTRELEQLAENGAQIARGGGVSYVAASFGQDTASISMRGFDRLRGFDPATGVLEVEAGISIAEVQRFALPRGWYLPITPGHPRATVGGCIAANVHGKNPALDGCFEAVTDALRLFHPQLGWRDAARGDPLWRASCGGFGLTGFIVSASLQLRRAPASLQLSHIPVANFTETAEALRAHAGAPVLLGWHDGRPEHVGRGAIRVGAACEEPEPATKSGEPLAASVRPFPCRFWHRPTLALANAAFRRGWHGQREVSLHSALTPLDRAGPYFAAFGPAGMLEAQWLLPHASFADFATALEALVHKQEPLITLISSKLFAGTAFGPALQGEGVALALHVPASECSWRFLEELAAVAIDHGGRPNPIKQSGLAPEVLAAAVPELDDWRSVIAAYNPGALLRSDLSRRLAW